MTVTYEWDVETVTATETEEHEENEVLDHDHRDSYAECVAIAAGTPPEGCRFEIVLVRDCDRMFDSGRSWAYVEDGALPTHFIDAYGREVAKVPLRFHREVGKLPASMLAGETK